MAIVRVRFAGPKGGAILAIVSARPVASEVDVTAGIVCARFVKHVATVIAVIADALFATQREMLDETG